MKIKKRKWLIGLLVGSMIMAMMPTMVFAESSAVCPGGEACQHGAAIGSTHYDTLEDAISAVKTNETIVMLKDYSYLNNGEGLLNINVSCTLDGDGHAINGYGVRGGNNTSLAINNNGSNAVAVTLTDLTINNSGVAGRPIETRGNISSLTLENCTINATGSGNNQGLTIGGNQISSAVLKIINSDINAGTAGYPIIAFNPIDLTMSGGTISGYCGIYFKGKASSAGSRGSVANISGSTFNCPNAYSGDYNDFGVFVFEDDGITVNLADCNIDGTMKNISNQYIFLFSDYTDRTDKPVNVTISGNSLVAGTILGNNWGAQEDTIGLVISGGQFSDNAVVKYADNLVIHFDSTTGNDYFVGAVEEIERFVSSNDIKAITVLKGDKIVLPDGVTVENGTGNDITVNDITVSINGTVTAHVHKYGNDWKFNDKQHWHECSDADCPNKEVSKKDVADHTWKWVVDKKATVTEKGSKHEECTVCGYAKAAVEIPATETPSDAPQTGDNSDMIVWAAVMLMAGIGMTGTFVYSRRKKHNG